MHVFGADIEPRLAHQIALPIAFAIITILHIVFGELAPKSFAIQRSASTTLFVAYPLQFFYVVFRPFIWFLNGIANFILKTLGIASIHGSEVHSSDELKFLVEQGKETGMIEETDYDIIKNAFDFSERTAREVLIPRLNVIAINIDDFSEEVLEKIIHEGFSRIPCYEETFDKVVGVLYLKDLLLKIRKKEEFVIRELMRPVMMIPESKRIGSLLKEFQIKHQQIAIVLNEYGGTAGIITMEDILEELVGQIQDEYDEEAPVVEKTNDRIYICQASASFHDINIHLPHPVVKENRYETLSGKLIHKFGRIPNINEKIIFDEYEFTILKKTKSAIALVKVQDLYLNT
jgi:CBS domain containing-hemolysin-like protein